MIYPRLNLAIIQNAISMVICLLPLPKAYLRLRGSMGDKHSNLGGFAKLMGAIPNSTANSCAYGIRRKSLVITQREQPSCAGLTL